jgi:hypothetical protein
MDGPAHYRKAEELAEKADEYLGQGDEKDAAAVWAAVAQVHATLAVAATFERTQTGSTHPEAATPQRRPEAARTSHGAPGNKEHRISVSFADRQNSDTRANCARRTYPRDHERRAVTGDVTARQAD